MSNQNHPKKGSTIKVEPIRDLAVIQKIKRLLNNHPRNYCLFTLGINTAFRASDLLGIKVGDVQALKTGDSLEQKELKTKKYRRVTLNSGCIDAICRYLKYRPQSSDDEYLFVGQRGVLTVQYLNLLVKAWCKSVNAPQLNYGSHTLRKTWGYHQRVTYGAEIPQLMEAFGHTTQKQTLTYLCIQAEEIQALYLNEL